MLFDLDGTLIDSKLDIADAANAARALFDLPPLPVNQVIPFIGHGLRHLIAGVLDSKSEARIDEGLKAAFAHYDLHLGEKTTLYNGSRELFETLRNKDIVCGVVSNKPHPLTLRTLHLLGIDGFFKAAFGDRPGVRRKPEPDAIFEALKQMEVTAADSVYVGDSAVDVECAHNAGMPSVIVTHGFGDKDELQKAGPDLVVGSLLELARLIP